ncbi:hypothetical protein [Ralstonia pickettii]|uniref:hypothetical protein n=1 Tax=Ralstonia pickettii TaxID=329 RepID=UPI0008187B3B|nr:hypothetical protein [Ralstonia pickettii]OCS48538.1 hypothetical protein BEK67_21225 [Ralstonia pickettii]
MEIDTLLSDISNTFTAAKTALAARDGAGLAKAENVFERQRMQLLKLARAPQEANAVLSQRVTIAEQENVDLRQQLTELLEREGELAQYKPFKTPLGGLCLAEQLPPGQRDRRVYVCAACAYVSRKSELEFEQGKTVLHCPECQARIPGIEERQGFIEFFGPTV